MRQGSPTRNAWPWGFFGLLGQDARRLIALQARLLVEWGVGRGSTLVLVSGFLGVPCAGAGRSERDHWAGVCIDQQQVLLRLGLLLAAGVLFVRGHLRRALTAACGALNRERWCLFPGARARSDIVRRAFWRHPEVGQRVVAYGQHMMHPVVRLRLAQSEVQGGHRVQRIGLLVDHNAQQCVSPTLPFPFGATADTALSRVACARAITQRLFS